MQNQFDVVVAGAGPAGTTAAALLAEKGRRVALLEREKFPRYHIGESLLPFVYFPLQRLGLLDRMRASHFPKKYSVQFVSTSGKSSVPFYFHEHMQHEASQTWQVLRSDFDRMLLDNALAKGAQFFDETKAVALLQDGASTRGVKAVNAAGESIEFHAPVTVDATGRDGFAVSRHGWRERDPYLNKISIWTYYQGAVRDPGIDEGATTVAFLPEKGWFWYIPLPNDTVSVGVVAEKDYLYNGSRDIGEIFDREVTRNAWIESHLAPGRRVEPHRVTGEFSYRSRYCAADGLVLIGDAFAFLDPVFSSGVLLAFRSGELAADAIDEALTAGDVSAARFASYGETMREGLEAMRRLVYAFYNNDFSFREFLMANPEMKGDLTDCLIGNLARDFEPMFRAISRFAALPEPLAHGQPLLASPCR